MKSSTKASREAAIADEALVSTAWEPKPKPPRSRSRKGTPKVLYAECSHGAPLPRTDDSHSRHVGDSPPVIVKGKLGGPL
jgi:hypothetical protein